ncbi:MAG: phenylalanine--tRNA ligase beta subunit-related protein [Alphaproteobacteria bacterium]|nr:phenylalanine--tRNA ligase beta subunit-related protein [Alphaproteobacteria bacterium]
MEYSLQTLNQRSRLKHLTLTNIIDTLNLIGFEVDDIFFENTFNNKDYQNIRLLLKVPANREDLANEHLLLKDLQSIFNFSVKNQWKLLKSYYSFILKQKYIKSKKNHSTKIQSTVPNVFIFISEIEYHLQDFSPFWIQKKLINSGYKPQNSIEDLLSLILLEWGELISFKNYEMSSLLNLSILSTNEIMEDESGNKKIIPKNTIVVKDSKNNIISFLGRFETTYSSLTKYTKVFEIIFYDIHENQLCLNPLESNISFRYLRNMFLIHLKSSLQRFLTLLELIYQGNISHNIVSTIQSIKKVSNYRFLKLNKQKLLNYLKSNTYNQNIFEKAGLKLVCSTSKQLYFQIPITRNDLKRDVDIIEEYCRFIGYSNFCEIPPIKTYKIKQTKIKPLEFIKTYFLNQGFQEINTNPIQDSKNKNSQSILLTNPLTNDYSLLRTELISQLFDNYSRNVRAGFETKNFFEIGRVFKKVSTNIHEIDKLGGIFQIENIKKDVDNSSEWFFAKGLLENFLLQFGYTKYQMKDLKLSHTSLFHPTRSIDILIHNNNIGSFGELNPKFKKSTFSKYATYLFEFDLSYFKAWRLQSQIKNYNIYSKYPIIIKDLSCSLSKQISFVELKKMIYNCSNNLKSVEFFDLYFSEKEKETININIRLKFQSFEKTLLTSDIEKCINSIQKNLNKKFCVIFDI